LAKLIYGIITSLDGFVSDPDGRFEWAAPDDEVHAFINDLERPIGTYLYGRRLYETMAGWGSAEFTDGGAAVTNDYANVWRAANKVVYSRTLSKATTPNTRIEREFDAAAVARMKNEASRDLTVGGPHLAAEALKSGLVDEIRFFVAPVVVGAGNRALNAGIRLDLSLLEHRRFAGGFVYLHYLCRAVT
jgi:dihydrofolate reductase